MTSFTFADADSGMAGPEPARRRRRGPTRPCPNFCCSSSPTEPPPPFTLGPLSDRFDSVDGPAGPRRPHRAGHRHHRLRAPHRPSPTYVDTSNGRSGSSKNKTANLAWLLRPERVGTRWWRKGCSTVKVSTSRVAGTRCHHQSLSLICTSRRCAARRGRLPRRRSPRWPRRCRRGADISGFFGLP